MLKNRFNNESGFTLVEIIVSTAIFVVVISSMLTLFNYTLKINRRVQALREVTQGAAAFTESLAREIRNGRIDYSSWTPECDASKYDSIGTKSLAITTKSGDKLCYYFDSDSKMYLKRQSLDKVVTEPIINSTVFSIDNTSFYFKVFPKTNPNVTINGAYPGIQPFVTFMARFVLDDGKNPLTDLYYQSTISTDVYDILK
jgi:prepilin-type N-terminal cleavage/methylation domain-containing protein